jgi:hypothetical protein
MARARAANPQGYSGTPLPKKLGIAPGAVVALVNAPPGFERTLGELPTGAAVRRNVRGARDVTLWFVPSARELERRVAGVVKAAGGKRLWIAWPKKTSGVATDVAENGVRDAGLACGVVDVKVCAIDATWSGLLFVPRRNPK